MHIHIPKMDPHDSGFRMLFSKIIGTIALKYGGFFSAAAVAAASLAAARAADREELPFLD